MLNIVEMIADITSQINEFKKENLDSIEKVYSDKMSKIAGFEKELSQVPSKYAGKSKTFIDKKRKQLQDKIADLKSKVDEWEKQQTKEFTDKVEKLLKDGIDAAKKAVQDELSMMSGASDLASKMSS